MSLCFPKPTIYPDKYLLLLTLSVVDLLSCSYPSAPFISFLLAGLSSLFTNIQASWRRVPRIQVQIWGHLWLPFRSASHINPVIKSNKIPCKLPACCLFLPPAPLPASPSTILARLLTWVSPEGFPSVLRTAATGVFFLTARPCPQSSFALPYPSSTSFPASH